MEVFVECVGGGVDGRETCAVVGCIWEVGRR